MELVRVIQSSELSCTLASFNIWFFH